MTTIGTPCTKSHIGQCEDCRADTVAARVAEEGPGPTEVEGQEPGGSAGQRQSQECNVLLPDPRTDEGELSSGDDAHSVT